ncbi:hypothetical protein KCP69_12905 [Salmonella enterica subsp. enterica]|nr:hypothetical protein KCP69_12905 [Salmonella enterica subsp. enterica]
MRINEATPVIGDVAMETVQTYADRRRDWCGKARAGRRGGYHVTPEELLTAGGLSSYILVISGAQFWRYRQCYINNTASMRAGYQIAAWARRWRTGRQPAGKIATDCRWFCTSTAFRRLRMLAAIRGHTCRKVVKALQPWHRTVLSAWAGET